MPVASVAAHGDAEGGGPVVPARPRWHYSATEMPLSFSAATKSACVWV